MVERRDDVAEHGARDRGQLHGVVDPFVAEDAFVGFLSALVLDGDSGVCEFRWRGSVDDKMGRVVIIVGNPIVPVVQHGRSVYLLIDERVLCFVIVLNDDRRWCYLGTWREFSDRKPGRIDVWESQWIRFVFVLVGSVVISLGREELDPCWIVFVEAVDGCESLVEDDMKLWRHITRLKVAK